jgi:hypothetical protein
MEGRREGEKVRKRKEARKEGKGAASWDATRKERWHRQRVHGLATNVGRSSSWLSFLLG